MSALLCGAARSAASARRTADGPPSAPPAAAAVLRPRARREEAQRCVLGALPGRAQAVGRVADTKRRAACRMRAAGAPAYGDAGESSEEPKKTGSSDIAVRVSTALLVGALGACAVLFGGLWFASFIAAIVYVTSGEYFIMLQAQGVAEGRELAPPSWAIALTRTFCTAVPFLTCAATGSMKAGLTVVAFSLLALQMLLQRRPHFSQFTSTVFGLFYCGYMPSFWVKLRQMGGELPVPALVAAAGLEGLWSTGLPATLLTVLCIVAADTGAYVGGKSFGRTALTTVSPKKTVEGAVSGCACALAVALAGSAALGWPGSAPRALALGSLVFAASLFGDLVESVLKRDAGVKDSGSALPGHGGLLDRFDSYMFTGATVYLFVRQAMPLL